MIATVQNQDNQANQTGHALDRPLLTSLPHAHRSASFSPHSPADKMSPTSRTHLFISYAVQDSALAGWLARKLSLAGYAVWFDRMKLLGGEPWPQDIDVAIKERTFRMLAILSENSIKKPNPSKERALALQISKDENIPDFLIPLKADGVKLDWLMTDLSYLPFNRGWADGWRQLLKKLDSINAPKAIPAGSGLAAQTFDAGAGLLTNASEEIVTNALLIKSVPEVLTFFEFTREASKDEDRRMQYNWGCYRVANGYLAFGPPPSEFQEMVRQTKTAFTWRDTREYEGIDVNNIVRHIIEQTLETRLKYSKCLPHPNNHRLFYLRSGWSPDGKIHYIGRGGKKTYKRIEGRARIWKQGVPKEVKHFFGFELKRWRLNDQTVAFQIRPTLVFAEPNGQLILDARVGSLRRRLTKMWYNAEWVNRLLAATQVISSASPIPGDGLVLESTTLRIQAPTGIREEMLVADPAEDEIAEDAVPELPEEDDEAEKAKESDESA